MRDNRQKVPGMWLCAGILFVLTFVMVKVEMGKGHEVLLYSDFATHSSWAVGEFTDPLYDKFYSYPVWHLAVRIVNRLLPIGREYAGALVTACCIGLLAAILYQFLWKELKEQLSKMNIVFLTIGLLILTALYMPWFNREVYLGQSSPTIWHNPTNMAVKPVSLIAFLYFLKLYPEKEREKWFDFAGFAAILLLSCFVKPSFMQGFLPAVVLFLLLELIRTKGESFWISLKLGAAFIPSGIYFLIQFFSVFGEGTDRGIGLQPFAVMKLDTAHPLISMVQAVAFPLFVLCIFGGKQIWKDKPLLFSLLFYLTSLLEFILLIEVNEPASGNFEWGLQLAMFTFFVMTAVRFYQQIGKKQWVKIVGNGLFLYHIGSGIYYYVYLLILSPLQC
ncbi:hypothetical protein [Candidatus Merdisoma sp. JLR.KK006]|uniref:hypothetical protein n=1 Tax=Candidatus Merdisoma sp. JLR.KK006 TaxID=3112626 RepID=UPI002FF39E2E